MNRMLNSLQQIAKWRPNKICCNKMNKVTKSFEQIQGDQNEQNRINEPVNFASQSEYHRSTRGASGNVIFAL